LVPRLSPRFPRPLAGPPPPPGFRPPEALTTLPSRSRASRRLRCRNPLLQNSHFGGCFVRRYVRRTHGPTQTAFTRLLLPMISASPWRGCINPWRHVLGFRRWSLTRSHPLFPPLPAKAVPSPLEPRFLVWVPIFDRMRTGLPVDPRLPRVAPPLPVGPFIPTASLAGLYLLHLLSHALVFASVRLSRRSFLCPREKKRPPHWGSPRDLVSDVCIYFFEPRGPVLFHVGRGCSPRHSPSHVAPSRFPSPVFSVLLCSSTAGGLPFFRVTFRSFGKRTASEKTLRTPPVAVTFFF